MISQILLGATVAIFIYFTMTSSWAAIQPRDTYPAVENDINEIVQMQADAPESIITGDELPAPKVHVAVVKKHKKAPHLAAQDFDVVPSNQIGPVVKRLKLVALILRDFGRAYDYRIHTVRELETILTQLQKSKKHPAKKAEPKTEPADSEPGENS